MPAIRYLDFDLSIEPVESSQTRYRVRVLNSPAGQANAEFELPYSALELENFLLRVGRPRRGVRRIDSPEMAAAKNFGSRLFEAVFKGQVQGCLWRSLDEARHQGHGLRIRLHVTQAPDLADLPWEYLYDSSLNRFFSYSTSTPIVRYIDLPQRIAPLDVKPPLNVLVMIASPRDQEQLDVEAEWRKVQDALADLVQRGVVTVTRLAHATLAALQRQLRQEQYHIFHFVGHGGFDRQTQSGVLLLEDANGLSRMVGGHNLGALLYDHYSLRLALLNACEGSRAARTDPFAGVAQHLVQQGVPAVIAMQFEITDQAAITLAHEFYAALADGYPVDAALAEARKAIYGEGNDIEWGTPVLFMRAQDGHLFAIEMAAEAQPFRRHAATAPPEESGATSALPEQVAIFTPDADSTGSAIQAAEDAAEQSLPQQSQTTLNLPSQSGAASSGVPRTIQLPKWSIRLAFPDSPLQWGFWLLGIGLFLILGYGAYSWLYKESMPPANPTRGTAWTDETYDITFVYVPSGEFTMGSAAGDSAEALVHRVALDSFWIMQTEVTNAQYNRCVAEKVCTAQAEDDCSQDEQDTHPVILVDWNQASRYAAWIGGRLPTEAEWEKAARGENGRTFPWGNEWDGSRVNYCDRNCPESWHDQNADDRYARMAPVGSYPDGVSPYGALDMAGNVWEWTSSLVIAYPYQADDGREAINASGDRVFRGGSWYSSQDELRSFHRYPARRSYRHCDVGFRVVRDDALGSRAVRTSYSTTQAAIPPTTILTPNGATVTLADIAIPTMLPQPTITLMETPTATTTDTSTPLAATPTPNQVTTQTAEALRISTAEAATLAAMSTNTLVPTASPTAMLVTTGTDIPRLTNNLTPAPITMLQPTDGPTSDLAATRLAEKEHEASDALQAIEDKANNVSSGIIAEIQSQETDANATALITRPASTPTVPFVQSPTDLPVLQAGATRTNPKDGAVYVWIPPGEFTMGSSDEDKLAIGNEEPQHIVDLDGFWIMRTEVTNAQYKRCVESDVCTEPNSDRWQDAQYANYPVTNVNWTQAKSYSEWVGGRLPTEAEWEKACRGMNGRIYPWGNQSPNHTLLYYHEPGEEPPYEATAVASYAAGANGLYDMAGNVWEWTADWYDEAYYDKPPTSNPKGPDSGDRRTVRGGSFHSNGARYVRCAARGGRNPGSEFGYGGFRVLLLGF